MLRWFTHPFTMIVFTIVVTWLYASLLRTEGAMRTSTESVAVLDQEVAQIASEVSALDSELALAKSSDAQEQRIRDELLLKKPGEYVIQLPAIEQQTTQVSKKTPLTPWQKWQKVLELEPQ